MEVEDRARQEQLLMLSTLIYIDDFFQEGKSVYDSVLEYNLDSYDDNRMRAGMRREQIGLLMDTVQARPDIYGQMQILHVKPNLGGTDTNVNMTVRNGNELYIIYKGTGSSYEWYDNGLGSFSNISDTPQQAAALGYYKQMKDTFGMESDQVFVAGHSKGGNKAQYVGILGEGLTRAYSFDGQGMGLGFIGKYEDKIIENHDRVISVNNKNDFVNVLLFTVSGEVYYTDSNINLVNFKDFEYNSKAQHSPFAMFEQGEDGLMYLGEYSTQSPIMKDLGKLFQYYILHMNAEDYQYIVHSIMHLMEGKENYEKDFKVIPPLGFFTRFKSLTDQFMSEQTDMDAANIINVVLQYLLGLGSDVKSRLFPVISGIDENYKSRLDQLVREKDKLIESFKDYKDFY